MLKEAQADAMSVTRSTSSALIGTAALQPRCLLPRCSRNTNASRLRFLNKIERIEIASVERFRGVAYFVIDVFLVTPVGAPSSSRIPAHRVPKTRESPLQHSCPLTRTPGIKSSNIRLDDTDAAIMTPMPPTKKTEPDFKIVRRFSDFDELHVRHTRVSSSSAVCASCKEFRRLAARSFVLAKVCQSVSLRKRILARFVQRTVECAVDTHSSRLPNSRDAIHNVCTSCLVLPTLVDDFLRRDMSAIERADALT